MQPLIALTPNLGAIYAYDGTPMSWTQIGGEASQIWAGGAGVLATNPANGDAYLYSGTPNQWERIGPAGAEFAVGDTSIIGLTPNRDGVYAWTGGTKWEKIGGPAAHIWAGLDVIATSPDNGDLYEWQGLPNNQWNAIGGRGAEFVSAAGGGILGLTPNRGAVYLYDDAGTSWTQIGGQASHIYGGGWGFVATNPANGDVYRWTGSTVPPFGGGTPDPMQWEQIGGPGAAFAIGDDTVYSLTPNRGAVYAYDGSGQSWTQIGGAASAIATTHKVPVIQ
jgi:Tectonin domain